MFFVCLFSSSVHISIKTQGLGAEGAPKMLQEARGTQRGSRVGEGTQPQEPGKPVPASRPSLRRLLWAPQASRPAPARPAPELGPERLVG